jgi:EAL domain-containing protein (putative c-di-GMP-specific phosphodiesterase class I)
LPRCRDACPDIIALDFQMPEMDGIEMLRVLGDMQVSAAIILLTGMDMRTVAAAEAYGASRGLQVVGTIRKPFVPDELMNLLLRAGALRRALAPEDLEEGIERGQLTVYYQPIAERFADGTWDITTVEALIRWDHPQRGILSPHAFVEMGESHGLGRRMTDFVLQRAIEQLKGWHAARLNLGLRVNVSANLINDIRFPDRLAALLAEHDVDPSLVTIEITETAMLGRDSESLDILSRLRLKGLNLAIDDFGTGYSSLTQLFQMPFNEMKIDKSLVLNVPKSKEARIIVGVLADLAHKLDLKVCAEGIETPDMLEFLSEIGANYAQGFFVSQPLVAHEIPQALRAWQERVVRAAPRIARQMR